MENNRAETGFIEKGKSFLKALAVVLSICGVMTIAPATEGMQAQGISGENSQIIEFVDDLQKSLPGLNRLYQSEGSSGNILFYRGNQAFGGNIIILTSGGYSLRVTRENNLKILNINLNCVSEIYSLSAIDSVFLCDPEAKITGRVVKEIPEEETMVERKYHLFYKPEWTIKGTVIKEEWENEKGEILQGLAEKILPSLIKYLELVTGNVTPDALLERIKTERKDYDIDFAEPRNSFFEDVFRTLLKNSGIEIELESRELNDLVGKFLRQCLLGTSDEPRTPLTDKILFDLIRSNVRLDARNGIIKYPSDIDIQKSDKKDKIIKFISLLRGGIIKQNPNNAPIVPDVAIGERVITKLLLVKTTQDQLANLFNYVFNGQGLSTGQTLLTPIEADWLKRALHTEVQYAILKKLPELRKDTGNAVSPLIFQPRTDRDMMFSLFDPCVSCARTPLILSCNPENQNAPVFLYVDVDECGNREELPYEPYLRYEFRKLKDLAPDQQSFSTDDIPDNQISKIKKLKDNQKQVQLINSLEFPKDVLISEGKSKMRDIDRRREAWSKGLQEPLINRLKKLNKPATLPPIFIKWSGKLK